MDDLTPAAPVAADPSEQPRYFSLSQRIGRLRYFVYSISGLLGCSALIVACYTFCLILPPAMGKLVFDISLVLIKAIAMPMVIFIMTIRRLHDMDFKGWWSLLAILPFITIILLFIPGSAGANRFGPAPRMNSSSLKMAAIVIPLSLYVLFFALKDAPSGAPQAGPAQGLPSYRQ